MSGSSLEDDVFAAFERACSERNFGVAEHLLRALEAIAQRDGDDDQLQYAFWQLAQALLPSQRHS